MTAIDRTSVRLAEAADTVRVAANAVGLPHAFQAMTYGHAAKTVETALSCGLAENNAISSAKAATLARAIYDMMLDCGEGVRYCLDYLGIDIVEGEPLPEWVDLP